MSTSPIPSSQLLLAAPELAALAVLDAALATAEQVLFAYHPALDDLGGTFQGRPPPLRCSVAAILVVRFEELQGLLAWYRLAAQPRPQDDDDFPF
jgi:hypothetical protein